MPLPIPKFIKTAFANIGLRNNIPEITNNTTGAAGYDRGFGEINMLPEGAGGIPPDGKDFNGVLYDLSAAIQYIQAGRSFPFNQDFADAIGGYGKGSLVSIDSDLSVVYKSKVDNNLTPPPGVNWEVSGEVSQATETTAGVAKIATQAKVNAGTDDQDFVTPAKLKLGFTISLSNNGFIVFPSWLGRLIIQWGTTGQISANATLSVNFPLSWPDKCFSIISGGTINSISGSGAVQTAINIINLTNTTFTVCNDDNAQSARWIAIGK